MAVTGKVFLCTECFSMGITGGFEPFQPQELACDRVGEKPSADSMRWTGEVIELVFARERILGVVFPDRARVRHSCGEDDTLLFGKDMSEVLNRRDPTDIDR